MMSPYLDNILKTNVLRQPTIKSAIEKLNLPKGSKGLDAGCGLGFHCLLLAEEIGPDGHVTGLDVSHEFLAFAENTVRGAGLEDRISLMEGNLNSIPYNNNIFDWVWSADCVGYGPWDPIPLLKELKRTIKPGGILAIIAWSSERLLPGYPMLEGRLSATTAGISPFTKTMKPSRHFPRALGWLRELGLADPRAHVFSRSVHAPLSSEVYRALAALFEMRWQGAEHELSGDDLEQFRHLCKPESPDFIVSQPDYYAFFTYSMFSGTVG